MLSGFDPGYSEPFLALLEGHPEVDELSDKVLDECGEEIHEAGWGEEGNEA
jgi:hypothetical protein